MNIEHLSHHIGRDKRECEEKKKREMAQRECWYEHLTSMKV